MVPLWVLCAHAHGVFANDLFVALLMAVFAFTNGYNASLGMMYGPMKVQLCSYVTRCLDACGARVVQLTR